MSEHTNPKGFEALHVPLDLCRRLSQDHIVDPTPIQLGAIPIAMAGKDVVGIAQTGTGKTLAFGLPMACRLRDGEVGLILAPTRELAQQIAETLERIHLKCVLVVGGAAMGPQISQLRSRFKVIVATPGRLMDHMDRGTVDLRRVSILVLDEADRMLDMGFAPSIRRIVEKVPQQRQTMLFSATMPKEIAELASRYLREPRRIEVGPTGCAPEEISQELMIVEHEDKHPVLRHLLSQNDGSVLVFARTRHGARKLAKVVRSDGHTAAELHSDRTLAQRRTALHGFKEGDYRVLVATDIAARGIDVKDISLVVNFDIPEKPEDYIHRIGRTGRAGSRGRAVTLAIPQQSREVRDIERLLGAPIRVVGSGVDPVVPSDPPAVTPPPSSRPAPAPAPTRSQPAARGHRGWSGRPNRRPR